jgi:threonylcarbamoyladenosine tRNA methylthiotransferase MtaB
MNGQPTYTRLTKTVAVFTLGCKANQYDTNRLLSDLAARGYTPCEFGEPASLYIINTCTVTAAGDRKSQKLIRRAKKQNPSALIAVCGCLAKLNKEIVQKTGADFIFDAREPESLNQWLGLTDRVLTRPLLSVRTRAYIKIQDGCDRFCSFCVVPYARGPVVSRPMDEIVEEARNYIAQGIRELVLTGIQTAAYGKDLTGGQNFPELIKKTAVLPGLDRLRLGSIEPYAADELFLEAIRHPVVCNHFHLSLQSGCDDTLRRMNRRYTTREYAVIAGQLHGARPCTALTTDIIVGFPGETDEEFDKSLDYIKNIGFARIHVFEYSPRSGTPAAGFPNQINAAVRKERGKTMRQAAAETQLRFLKSHIGKCEKVLFESIKDGLWEGHTTNYVTVRAKNGAENLISGVWLESIKKGVVYGTVNNN